MPTFSKITADASTLAVKPIHLDSFFLPRRPAPPIPHRNHLAVRTKPTMLALQSFVIDPLLIPRRPAPSPPKRSRFFAPNNPTAIIEQTFSEAEKAEVWAMAVEKANYRRRSWSERKNPKHLRVNSTIIEEKINDGSIVIGL